MTFQAFKAVLAVCLLVSAVVIVWNVELSKDGVSASLEERDSVSSELHDLSSSSLVQRAAADCAADQKCIPTVDELVNRAAAACASDPRCVCDWAKYPKKCFLSEVARHKQLTHDAKELVSLLRSREDKKAKQLQSLKKHNTDFNEILAQGRHDLESNNIAGAKKELVKAEIQHKLTEASSDGRLDLHIPVEQTDALEAFARQVVAVERAKAESTNTAPVSNAVTRQLAALSSQIKVLMKKVAERRQPQPQSLQQKRSTLPLTTAEQIRELTEDVARLTGKVSELQQKRTMSTSSSRMQQLSDEPNLSARTVIQHRNVEHERSLAVKQQERALAAALKRGKLAVEAGNPLKAKDALAEVEYYRRALARLKGEYSSCAACDSLKQEVSSLASELLTPSSSTELSESASPSIRRSATALEKSFDSYLSVGDQALVHGKIDMAKNALHRATGRFAELETMKLPGADAVIKHEMRDALRALRRNIRSQEKRDGVDGSADKEEEAMSAPHHARTHSEDMAAHRARAHHARLFHVRRREQTDRDNERSRSDSHAAALRSGDDADEERDRNPESSALLQKMLKRPGFYNAKTLRMATEGLKTATLKADGTLQAMLGADAMSRIKKHFSES